MVAALSSFVKSSKWTGGGEIEFVENMSGERFLIDFNPRFGAWIFASSFASANLPAELIHYAVLTQRGEKVTKRLPIQPQSNLTTGAVFPSSICYKYSAQ